MNDSENIAKRIKQRLKDAPSYAYTCTLCGKPAGSGTRPMDIIHFACWKQQQIPLVKPAGLFK